MKLLKKIKRFDVFREVHNDFTHSSTTGAIVSLICMSVMFLLIVTEFVSFLSVKTTSNMFVQKPSQSKNMDQLQINIFIDFPEAPCAILSLDVVDVMGSHSVDVSETLSKKPIGTDQKGCSINGFILVNKVPGNFHFSTHSDLDKVEKMNSRGQILNLSHRIRHLSFGGDSLVVKGKDIAFNPLDSTEKINEKTYSSRVMFGNGLLKHKGTFEYYLKIVPTIHKKISGKVSSGYQFSSNHKHFGADKFPAIFFRYEFSPITVEFSESREGISTFIVKMLGIVGGVFTGFSLVSTWLNLSVARIMKKANENKLG